MKKDLRIVLRKIASALSARLDLMLENMAPKHRIAVLERSARRPQFTNADRLLWITLSALWLLWLEALEILQTDTVKRGRRHGFWHYLLGRPGRRRRLGRPAMEPEIPSLIQRMSLKNVLWGAPRVHGELLKLSEDVCQTTVAKYMARRVGPPSQSWRTFLRNHARQLVNSEILPRPFSGLQVVLTRVAVAIRRWLTAEFHKQLSSHATPAWDVEDERISCQAILRPQSQKVIASVDFASMGPLGVKPLSNDSSLPRTPVDVLCPVTTGSMSRVRWRQVTKTIDRRCHPPDRKHTDRQTLSMWHFHSPSDRLAA